jgi:hypothetical protein
MVIILLGNCFSSSDFLELHGPGKVGVQGTQRKDQGYTSRHAGSCNRDRLSRRGAEDQSTRIGAG